MLYLRCLQAFSDNREPHMAKVTCFPDALGVRLNIGGYACNLGLHSYVLFPCQIWLVPTLQVVRCISACIYAAFKSSISEWSFLRSA